MRSVLFHFESLQSISLNICSALIFSFFTTKDYLVLVFYSCSIIILYLLSVELGKIIQKYDRSN